MAVDVGVKVCVAVAEKVAVDVCVKVGVKVKVAVFVNVGVGVRKNSPALVSTKKYKMMMVAKTILAKNRIRFDMVFATLDHHQAVHSPPYSHPHLHSRYYHYYYLLAFLLVEAGQAYL